MTDIVTHIKNIMAEKNWSAYRLSKETGLSPSTIINMFNRGTTPSIPTLETICTAFGITLAQFFAEGNNMVSLSTDQMDFFNKWAMLTPNQKRLLQQLIDEMK